MLNSSHTHAERFAGDAELAARRGDIDEAIRLYQLAASWERKALATISVDQVRTRGILAISLASLLYKAREWGEAEQAIYEALANGPLHEAARLHLKDLLEVVWDERKLAEELSSQYAEDSFLLSLRGGQVGFGTAPLDQFLQTFEGVRSMFVRVAEWVAKRPFRTRGLAHADIRNAFQARVAEQTAGSYRFRIRLIEPSQKQLFEPPPVRIADVCGTLFEFVAAASGDEVGAVETILPDLKYRESLLKILRNIAPDGRRIKELQISRQRAGRIEDISIFSVVRQNIGSRLRESRDDKEVEDVVHGNLRALDLDGAWVELALQDDTKKKCFAQGILLDDVVGPMVNHNVVLHGTNRPFRDDTRFYFSDIEFAESNGEPSD